MQRMGIVLITVLGCTGDGSPPPVEGGVSYRRDVQPIWDRWCIGCHDFHEPQLVATMSAQELMGESWWKCDGETRARFVTPGDPARSYLLYKLTGENTNNYAAECHRPMPANHEGKDTPLVLLDPEAVATIRQWIEEGASFD
jgi:hypothetical protein